MWFRLAYVPTEGHPRDDVVLEEAHVLRWLHVRNFICHVVYMRREHPLCESQMERTTIRRVVGPTGIVEKPETTKVTVKKPWYVSESMFYPDPKVPTPEFHDPCALHSTCCLNCKNMQERKQEDDHANYDYIVVAPPTDTLPYKMWHPNDRCPAKKESKKRDI